MDDNWWALYVAIFTKKEVTPDQALRLYCFGRKTKKINLQQKINIKKNKERGVSNTELANIYGLSYSSISRIVGEMKGVQA